MNDQAAKLFAGQTGVCAVLVDVLIDKGIISHSEFFDRFQRAHAAAGRWSGGFGAARALTDIIAYLEPATGERSVAALDPSALEGQAVLVVEEEPAAARALREALENAGAEVMVARNAAEALSRIAQFEFSAALLDWRPEQREHRTLTRWLREDGVPFLVCAARPPDEGDAMAARGEPMLLKTAPPEEIVRALARLAGVAEAERNLGAA